MSERMKFRIATALIVFTSIATVILTIVALAPDAGR